MVNKAQDKLANKDQERKSPSSNILSSNKPLDKLNKKTLFFLLFGLGTTKSSINQRNSQ